MSVQTHAGSVPPPRKPGDIVRDALLNEARKIELLKMIKDHNAAPWQQEMREEAERALALLLTRPRH